MISPFTQKLLQAPGVRRADIEKARLVRAANNLPKLVVYSWGSSGFASLA
jgi:hypothetical protein